MISIVGSKSEAQQIKTELITFLKDELNLSLNQDKTTITHWEHGVKFLGYLIT
jgi:hypothetical protein